MTHFRTPLCTSLLLAGLMFHHAVPAQEQELPQLSQTRFESCLGQLQDSPAFAAISGQTFERYTHGLKPDASILPLLDRQPEFTIPVWDYLATLVDEERVADGRAAARAQAELLQRIKQRYQVPAATVLAVWGVESNFGQILGGRPLLQSLSTLSCFGRRQDFFRGELAATLKILQEGHVDADKLNGSWAGAFGQTQFMPSTFLRLAVDFDGDGRRDIVESVPDALASTANYLQKAGWRDGQVWGYEVQLPANHALPATGRKNKRDVSSWRQAGVKLADGSPLPDTPSPLGLMIPAPGGPAFLVGKNFDAIFSYNASENYGLAIAHLSDLIAQPARDIGFEKAWPTDDAGLSRAQNRQLQRMLLDRGHDIGEVDGLIGAKTRKAIKLEQFRLGMDATGRAGQKLFRALQAS